MANLSSLFHSSHVCNPDLPPGWAAGPKHLGQLLPLPRWVHHQEANQQQSSRTQDCAWDASITSGNSNPCATVPVPDSCILAVLGEQD